MKQTKRVLAVVLALVSLLILCATAAFAESEANITDTTGPVIKDIKVVSSENLDGAYGHFLSLKVDLDEHSPDNTVYAYLDVKPVSRKDNHTYTLKVPLTYCNNSASPLVGVGYYARNIQYGTVFAADMNSDDSVLVQGESAKQNNYPVTLVAVDGQPLAETESEICSLSGSDMHADVTVQKIVAYDKYGNMTEKVPEKTITEEYYKEGNSYSDPVITSFTVAEDSGVPGDSAIVYYDTYLEFNFAYQSSTLVCGEEALANAAMYIYDKDGNQVQVINRPRTTGGNNSSGFTMKLIWNFGKPGYYTVVCKITDMNGRSAVSEPITLQLLDGGTILEPTIDNVKMYVNGKQVMNGEKIIAQDTLQGINIVVEADIENIDHPAVGSSWEFETDGLMFEHEAGSGVGEQLIYRAIQIPSGTLINNDTHTYRFETTVHPISNENQNNPGLVNGVYVLSSLQVKYRDYIDQDVIYAFDLTKEELKLEIVDEFTLADKVQIFDRTGHTFDKLTLSLQKDGTKAEYTVTAKPTHVVEETITVKGKTITQKVDKDDVSIKKLEWNCSDPTVAMIIPDAADPNKCVIKAIGEGKCRITATTTDGTKISDYINVYVTKDVLTSIKLSDSEVTLVSDNMNPNPSYQLEVTELAPDTALDSTYTWETSDKTVANVTVDGLVFATGKLGTAVITCKANVGTASASCKVTVTDTVVVTDVILDQKSATLAITHADPKPTLQLKAVVAPETASVKALRYTTDNGTVATVDENGLVTAVSAGVCTIKCAAVNGIYDSCVITVTDIGVEEIKLDTESLSFRFDADTPFPAATIEATVLPAAAKQDLLWISENEAVATVKNGVVTPVKDGATFVYALATDKTGVASKKVAVTVSTLRVTGLTLDKTALTLNATIEEPNPSATLTGIITPAKAYNQKLIWTSTDENVAIVKDGKVTAQKPGLCLITARSAENGGYYAQCTVKVTSDSYATTVTLNKSELSFSLKGGEAAPSEKLTAAVKPSSATQSVKWYSDNETIATVSANGLVTAVAPGTCKIYARATDGSGTKSEPCTVKVTAVKVSAITLSESELTLNINKLNPNPKYHLTATVLPTDAFNPALFWISSNEKVATVENGTVIGHSAGTAVISCAAVDGSGIFFECKVTVIEEGVKAISFSRKQLTLKITKKSPAPSKNLVRYLRVQPSTAAYRLRWSTSNRNVVTVKNGLAVAKAAGTATITVKVVGTGLKATMKITVK